MLTKSRIVALATAVVAIFGLALFAWRDGAITQAAPGGLLNPGFEAGLTSWSVQSAPDAVVVVGTEGPAQFPTYADMGGATVTPFKGTKMLRLGTPKKISESQNPDPNAVSQTFTSNSSTLRFSFWLFSWEHRGRDLFRFDLGKASGQALPGLSVKDLNTGNPLVVTMVDGSTRTCSTIPCEFSIDVGKRGQYLSTGWMKAEIGNVPVGQSLTLSYGVGGTNDSAHGTWAYFDNVNTPPVAKFSFQSIGTEILEGDVVQFTDESFDPDFPDDDIVDWQWVIDNETIDEQSPFFIFSDQGMYSACLTVTDGFGDSDEACTNAFATDGTFIEPLTLSNADPEVNASDVEALSGVPVPLFGRLLEPGWTDDASGTWQLPGQPPQTGGVQNDKLPFISTGVVTGQATVTGAPGTLVSGTLTVNDGPDGGSGSDPFDVTIVDANPQRDETVNNDLVSPPILPADKAYLYWIQSAGDRDFFEVRLPNGSMLPAGGEVLVTLKGLATDFDLVILSQAPGQGAPGQAAILGNRFGGNRFGGNRFGGNRFGGNRFGGNRFGGNRFGGNRFGGNRFGAIANGSLLYPMSQIGFTGLDSTSIGGTDVTLEELGLGAQGANLGVATYSANHGTASEVALAHSDVNGTRFYVAVLGANGTFSSAPYTLQIETSLPLDLETILSPAVCSKSALVKSVAQGGDPLNPPTTNEVDLNLGFPPAGSQKTLIVTQRERIIALSDDPLTTDVNEGLAAWAALLPKLQALAQHPGVMADVISIRSTYYDSWDSSPCSVDEANAVAANIRGRIRENLGLNPSTEYVVLAGDDDVIPQRRVPDETVIGNEANYLLDALVAPGSPLFSSILGGFILSDDYYVDEVPTPWQGRELYVPDRAIGRLVETPQEIGLAIDTFLDPAVNGQLDYSTAAAATALVTGYDFFGDGAQATAHNLDDHLNVQTLIDTTPTNPLDDWDADDLRCRMLGQAVPGLSGCAAPSVTAANAHYTHYAALSAFGYSNFDFSDFLNSNEAAGAPGPALQRKVVFTMGCHAGLNVPNRASLGPDPGLGVDPGLDFAQAMAQQRAVFIASTGYGLGDDAGLGGTELLLTIFADKLVPVDPTLEQVVIGKAFRQAKISYLTGLSAMTVYDEKSSIQATLFGLPMYTVKVPAASGSITTLQAQQVSEHFTINVDDGGVTSYTPLKEPHSSPEGTYYTADGDAQLTAFRPVEPRLVIPLDPANPAQGVLITGGSFTDSPDGFDPVISLPTEEWQSGVTEAQVCLNAFWPSVPVTLNSLDPGGGGPQALVVTPGQFRCTGLDSAGNVRGVQRLYTQLDVQVLHSNPSDTQPPEIGEVSLSEADASNCPGQQAGLTCLAVTIEASDPSGIAEIVVLKLSNGTIDDIHHTPLDPFAGSFTVYVPNVQDGDDIIGQVEDGADNVAYFTAKGVGGYTFLDVDAGADQLVTPGQPVTFQVSVPDFGSLVQPFYTFDFGDGTAESGPVPGTLFTVTKEEGYAPNEDFPLTATLKVTDANGNNGTDTATVRLRCDPTGDSADPNSDFTSCDTTNTATTVTIAVRVAGVISDAYQYRIDLDVGRFNSKTKVYDQPPDGIADFQLRYDNGKATGPLGSLQVTVVGGSELHFTFNVAEVNLQIGEQVLWSAESQKGEPGVPTVGFPDKMPDSGFFSHVLQ